MSICTCGVSPIMQIQNHKRRFVRQDRKGDVTTIRDIAIPMIHDRSRSGDLASLRSGCFGLIFSATNVDIHTSIFDISIDRIIGCNGTFKTIANGLKT